MLTIGCDQISKEMTRQTIEPQAYIPIIGHHFVLTNVENTGAMLGFGRDFPPMVKRIFFQGVPFLVFIILLFRSLTRPNLNRFLLLASGLIIGGGSGNLMDRIAPRYITDFFQIRLWFLRTGIFNVADVSMTIGVLMPLVLMSMRSRFRIRLGWNG